MDFSIKRLCLAALGLLLLTGCSFQDLEHDPTTVFPDPEAYAETEKVVQAFLSRDQELFESLLHPDAAEKLTQSGLQESMYDELPSGENLTSEIFYAELRTGGPEYDNVPVYFSLHDVIGDEGYALLQLAVYPHEGECCTTSHISIQRTFERTSTYNDFTFQNKGALHYFIFALLLLVPTFIIVTTVACVRNKNFSKKFIWVPFILVGLWGIEFNWTTGAITSDLISFQNGMLNFNLLSVKFLGAGFVKKGLFVPWIASIGAPVGAIAYWFTSAIKRKKLRAEEADLVEIEVK